MVEIENLHKTYHNGTTLHVLKGINLYVKDGEFLSIMGASGSGKSTLLNIMGILDTYDNGSYFLAGNLIKSQNETQAARLRNEMIGFVFQSFNLISYKTALENVALPLYYKGYHKRKRNEMALDFLDSLGLKDWAGYKPDELSGGQKQRVAIARALITNPKLILADEPTGALDSATSNEVIELLKKVNKELGMSIICVTHEKGVAEQTDRTVYIKDGIIMGEEINNNK